MGIWKIDTDVLAGSRFVVSAMTETLACLLSLEAREATPGQELWLREHLAGYDRMKAANPLAQPFLRAALRPGYLADFLTVPPRLGDRGFAGELARVRETPPAQALADLGDVPAGLSKADVPAVAATVLEWVWVHTVEPGWARKRRVFEADIVARTNQVSTGGWAAALDGMRPGMRWLGDGRLRINMYDNPPRTITDAQLFFIPSTAGRGWVDWELPSRYAIVYPCAGLLAALGSPGPEHALARLIGPARAAVLRTLDTPCSTTQLVALTGQALGSVGGHLRVLLDAQLIARRRSGRSVLYYRTTDGDRLVRNTTPG